MFIYLLFSQLIYGLLINVLFLLIFIALVSFTTITNEHKSLAEKYGLEIYSWEEFLHLVRKSDIHNSLYYINFMRSLDFNQQSKDSKDAVDLPMKMTSDICTIMYTSGTTGEPKGVMITNEIILSMLSGVTHHLDSMSEEVNLF